MHLSNRLKKIASLIDENDNFIYDVGCDHALLDIYLAQKYNHLKFLASDISSKCIDKAKNNIKHFNLTHRIDTSVNNGLSGVRLVSDSTIIISGMGAHTIIDILSNTDLTRCKKIIIQSNNDFSYLRRQMVKRGFEIVDEIVVYDKKFYIIIVFRHGGAKYNNICYEFGPKLLSNSKHNQDYFKCLYEQNIDLLKKVPIFKWKKRFEVKYKLKVLKKVIH